MLVRGFYYEGCDPSGKPIKERDVDEFLAHAEAECRNLPHARPERLVKAVFRLLTQRISAAEIDDVKSICPSHLRELWPEPVEAHCSHGRHAGIDDDPWGDEPCGRHRRA